MTTLDPVYEQLTRTHAGGTWNKVAISETRCRLIDAGSGGCWAANPSAFNTHWFASSCSYYDALSTGVDYNAIGNYYNWDFLLPNLRTDVTQSVRIRLVHGTGVAVSFSHVDSGEASSLIYGSYYQTGTNTCFSIT